MCKSEYKTPDGKTTYVFDPKDSYSVGGKVFEYCSLKKFTKTQGSQSKFQIITFSKNNKDVLKWLEKCLSVEA